jgi:hypothetical protein
MQNGGNKLNLLMVQFLNLTISMILMSNRTGFPFRTDMLTALK